MRQVFQRENCCKAAANRVRLTTGKEDVFMNEHSRKLLQECSSGCKMAMESMDQVEKYVQDDTLQSVIAEYRKKHDELEQKASELLAQSGNSEKEPGAAARAFSWITTEMKMMMKEDNNQIAKLLMDGCNMGIQSITEYQHEYCEASKEAEGLADDLVKMEEEFSRELKKFL